MWAVLAILAVLGGLAAWSRRRGYESVEDEPWRASLDDEPLDMEEARRAEDEFLQGEAWQPDEEDEPWR